MTKKSIGFSIRQNENLLDSLYESTVVLIFSMNFHQLIGSFSNTPKPKSEIQRISDTVLVDF